MIKINYVVHSRSRVYSPGADRPSVQSDRARGLDANRNSANKLEIYLKTIVISSIFMLIFADHVLHNLHILIPTAKDGNGD